MHLAAGRHDCFRLPSNSNRQCPGRRASRLPERNFFAATMCLPNRYIALTRSSHEVDTISLRLPPVVTLGGDHTPANRLRRDSHELTTLVAAGTSASKHVPTMPRLRCMPYETWPVWLRVPRQLPGPSQVSESHRRSPGIAKRRGICSDSKTAQPIFEVIPISMILCGPAPEMVPLGWPGAHIWSRERSR